MVRFFLMETRTVHFHVFAGILRVYETKCYSISLPVMTIQPLHPPPVVSPADMGGRSPERRSTEASPLRIMVCLTTLGLHTGRLTTEPL